MYQVTATRRRPKTFDELLGQEFVSATLKKSIESGKIAHAYLFSGPRGCGKTSTARILAKAINCESGPTPSPCGVCNSCTQITSGSSFDVIEIDGASNTGVDDVRKLKDEILFPPHSSRYKVYIIDEVHMLSTNAFNALLKTIEEPPPYVVFIFATTELHKVPATIKSRCQQFNFKLVDIQLLHDALAQAASEQGIEADDEALFWIAREGTGSVRDSYTLFDQVAAFSGEQITLEKIQDKLGLTGIETINELVLACVQKNANKALSILHECLNNGVSVEQFTIDCTKYFRSLLLVKHGITKEGVLGQRASRFSVEVLQGWTSTQIERALSLMFQLFKDIHLSVDPAYEAELAVSRLAWLSDYVPPDELKAAYEKIRLLLSGKSSNQDASPRFDSKNDGQSENGFNFKHQQNPLQAEPIKQAVQPTEELPPIESYEGHFDSFSGANSFSSQPIQEQPNVEHKVVPSFDANPKASFEQEVETIRFSTIDEIKKALISNASSVENLLVVALNEAVAWDKTGETVKITLQKRFHLDTINKNLAFLTKILRNHLPSGKIVTELFVENASNKESSTMPETIKNLMYALQAQVVEVRERKPTEEAKSDSDFAS